MAAAFHAEQSRLQTAIDNAAAKLAEKEKLLLAQEKKTQHAQQAMHELAEAHCQQVKQQKAEAQSLQQQLTATKAEQNKLQQQLTATKAELDQAWKKWQKDTSWYKKNSKEQEHQLRELQEKLTELQEKLTAATNACEETTINYTQLSQAFEDTKQDQEDEQHKHREVMNQAKQHMEELRDRIEKLEIEKTKAMSLLRQNEVPIVLVKAAPAGSQGRKRSQEGNESKEKVWKDTKWLKLAENVWEMVEDTAIPLHPPMPCPMDASSSNAIPQGAVPAACPKAVVPGPAAAAKAKPETKAQPKPNKIH